MSGWREQASTTALYLEAGKKARRTDEDGEQLLMLAKGGAKGRLLSNTFNILRVCFKNLDFFFCLVCFKAPFFLALHD